MHCPIGMALKKLKISLNMFKKFVTQYVDRSNSLNY